jgi:hypothetical protein
LARGFPESPKNLRQGRDGVFTDTVITAGARIACARRVMALRLTGDFVQKLYL